MSRHDHIGDETHGLKRLRLTIHGAVQGVGFRPYVYRLAGEYGLTGWVRNDSRGVFIEAEGRSNLLETFLLRLQNEVPPLAFIVSLEFSYLDPIGYHGFEIRQSDQAMEKTAYILPDIATCADCRREILTPDDRRAGYSFTNCTNCGPRYSIIEALPYDRCHTSMRVFSMCPACQQEYDRPSDRRFHAQPNACPVCGPKLALWDEAGQQVAPHRDAIATCADAIRDGKIIALKGLGGFQLIVDACSPQTVKRLRRRKHREEKPFALMFPAIEMVRQYCHISALEERLLTSPQSPIVLLRQKTIEEQSHILQGKPIAANVAPDNPHLGTMLPYTPLHHLLMRALHVPIVATSGNLTDEPMAIDNQEAVTRLKGIADLFLVHDRPVVRPVDDSVARVILGREQVLRRARGYAPLPVLNPRSRQAVHGSERKILAVGAHLKNTVAIGTGDEVFISQHIGDLETGEAYAAMQRAVESLQTCYAFRPEVVACDMHPGYLSTQYARSLGLPVVEVQHHHAHLAACMGENELSGTTLGIVWDGTGYGTDGTIWGGEFLLADDAGQDGWPYKRVAHLRPFRLPSGDKAIREPRRTALGALYDVYGEEITGIQSLSARFTETEQQVLIQMLQKKINDPLTSSAGRLFDAVASLIGLRQKVSFEGQAAMELEFILQHGVEADYPFEICDTDPLLVDWHPTIRAILAEHNDVPVGVISAKFHNTLVEMMLGVAKRVGVSRVCLTGGVFQNRYLTQRSYHRLTREGFKVYIHQRIPPNDGAISFGQIRVAAQMG